MSGVGRYRSSVCFVPGCKTGSSTDKELRKNREVETTRPNIRIQIQNSISKDAEEKMDMDLEENENEEGEISDDNEKDHNILIVEPSPVKKVSTGVFTTGINIFDKKEQEKLQERAKRFALKPEEINSFTDEDLQDLYDSLGINSTNENEVKFQTVNLVGLDEMSAEDVVDHFASYAPEGIEWIDENSCNIIWLDNISAARSLHFKSRAVKDMPARQPKEMFPKEFLDDVEDQEQEETGQSILIKNINREVELQNEIGEVILPKKKNFLKNSADISEITIPVPPGYWRLGNPHPKTKCLLMRYGLLTDKLPFKSEKCSKYYKKLANPGQRNVISESKKKELRSIFERNRELNQGKNPWGSLAKNWDSDAKFREREPVMHKVDDEEEDFPVVEIKNPKLMARLGTKRKLDTESDDQKSEEKEENDDVRTFISEKKKTKMPRMKMYADEEEENMKRRKMLQSIKKQTEEIDKKESERDLRNILGPISRLVTKKDVPESEPTIDLGTKLKNRSQKMVYAIERDLFDREELHEEHATHSDARTNLVEHNRPRYNERDRSPLVSRSVLLRKRERRLSIERIPKSPERSHRSSRRRTPERTLHSDRIASRKSTDIRRRSYSPDRRYGHKPRSKVAVVVRPPKKPTVASTIWSKVRKTSESEQSSSEQSEESENSSSSSDSKSESEESDDDKSDSSSKSSKKYSRNPDRPGFDKRRLAQKLDHKSPLKITMANEHYKKNRK